MCALALVMVSGRSPQLLGLDVLSLSATANLLYVFEDRSFRHGCHAATRLGSLALLSQAGDLLVGGCK